jgi:hypothetical protein
MLVISQTPEEQQLMLLDILVQQEGPIIILVYLKMEEF